MRYITIFFILSSLSLYAQKVTVYDADTRDPIAGVALYNEDKSKSALTDFDGQADISAFESKEIIIFSELAHKEAQFTKEELATTYKFKIFLKQKENQLGEVVLSASKFAQSRRNIPQKIVGISSDFILRTNPQTSADLLEKSGQVFVQKSQLGGGSPIIRGFSTNRLLITLDGIRFNTAIFRGGNVQNIVSIDPFTIDRSEVILGPGSVVYGSDAIGGVLNFYTKKPKFSGDKPLVVSGNALARYSTANEENTGHFDINIGTKKWSFLSSASYSDYEDQRQGSNGPDDFRRIDFVQTIDGNDVVIQNDNPNEQVGSGFSSYSLAQKIRFTPNPIWDFNLSVLYSTTSDYDRYDRLFQRDENDQLEFAEWFFGPQDWFLTSFQINKEGQGKLYDRVQATASFQHFEESRNDRRFGRAALRTRTERVNVASGSLDFTKTLHNPRNKIFYGTEYVYNHVNSNGSQTDISTGEFSLRSTRYPDGSDWQSLAAYASGQFELHPKLRLNTGIRYNQIFIFADFRGNNQFFNFPFEESRLNFGNLTGSAGLNYELSKTVLLKTNLSTAFRAPNIDDLGKVFDSDDGDLVIPNPDLRAEYAYNAELGGVFNFGDIVKLDVNGYFTRLNDALVRRDFTLNGSPTLTQIDEETGEEEVFQIEAIQNASTAEIWGLESGIEINLSKIVTPGLKVTSQFNLIRGTQEEEDGSLVPVRHVSPDFGNTHISYSKGRWTFDAYVMYAAQFEFEDLSPEINDRPELFAQDENGDLFSPRWYTLNFSSQFQLNTHWKFNANLENITDQRYRTYSSGISAAGRNLILSASYSF